MKNLICGLCTGFTGLVIWASLNPQAIPNSNRQVSEAIATITGRQPTPAQTNIVTNPASLFQNKKSIGSIAVGHAEGNMRADGAETALTLGHTDPGNLVTNRGFCSWNKAANLTVKQADNNCMKTLQGQAKSIYNGLKNQGVAATKDAVINGADLMNQSPRAGADFPVTYKGMQGQSLSSGNLGKFFTQKAQGFGVSQPVKTLNSLAAKKQLTPKEKRTLALLRREEKLARIVAARVEAFRTPSGELSASGLFRICRVYPYYSQQLSGFSGDNWRWWCISLDQERRVRAINEVLSRG